MLKVRRTHDPNLAEDTDPNLLPFGSPAHGWKFVQSSGTFRESLMAESSIPQCY